MKMKSIIFGISCSLLTATSFAGENFSTLNGIPAEVMSNTEMNNVEGKSFDYNYFIGLLWVNDNTGDVWHWNTGIYLGRRNIQPNITLNDIKNAFPDSYRQSRNGSSKTGTFYNDQLFANLNTSNLSSAHSNTFSHSTRPGSRR